MTLTATLIVLGRLLLGGAFLLFGIRNIANITRLTGLLEKRGKVPSPRLVVTAGVALQIVSGALVAVGGAGPFGVFGGIGLAVFVAVAAILFHPFWEYQGDERTPHLNACIMNASLVGACLLVVAVSL